MVHKIWFINNDSILAHLHRVWKTMKCLVKKYLPMMILDKASFEFILEWPKIDIELVSMYRFKTAKGADPSYFDPSTDTPRRYSRRLSKDS